MERTETVCCYCGVSYLIFHEFQQLRTELTQLEAELQDLRETAQKEKAQREALELGRLEWERALREVRFGGVCTSHHWCEMIAVARFRVGNYPVSHVIHTKTQKLDSQAHQLPRRPTS
uniref:Uncharacterized protein n=1 Tax=Astatotilapia calliptera TaxID=8154 RepID=A0AAX7VCE8_ASTCA